MLQIKKTQQRNLDIICEEHYSELRKNILAKLSKLNKRQSDFIIPNLKRILTGKPADLYKVHGEFIHFCKEPGRNSLKKPNRKLNLIFDYRGFTRKSAGCYCGYDLAKKIDIKTCPYCNRNYTVTVGEGKSRVVRPDFDHFFPKSQYPLLALSFYNLIPSCSICNRTIKNQATIVYGKYVHPYEEGYDEALKINYLPSNADSAVGLKANYKVLTLLNPTDPPKAIRCEESFKLFKLKEIYEESHSGEIADIIKKYYVSGGGYLETLHKSFPNLGSMDELFRIAFGGYYHNDDFEKRPLSKLTRDVVDQLSFTFPTLV